MRRASVAATLAALLVTIARAGSGEAPALSAAEAKRRWSERLAGREFTSSVTLHYRFGAKTETRTATVWRDDPGGAERLMARFESPANLRGFGLLYLEQSGRSNDYFIYQPETKRVRRIAAATASQDIYGVDLEFLGFGVAQRQETEVESIARAELAGRPVWRLEERALTANQRFDQRTVYLDPESFIALRVEHRLHGEPTLIATTEETALVQGVPTPIRTRFERPRDANEVVMVVDSIDYEKAIPGAFFSTLSLIRP